MLAQYYHILKDLMKYKSISPDAQYFPEMQGVATYLQKLFQEHKWEVEVVMGYGNPIIVASFATNKKNPTCLLYGHYDVQFADKSEGWKHDPFALYLGKDKIYGRGVADNKGQFLIHLITLFELSAHKNLCYNVKVVLEGDEENGSHHFQRFLTDYKDRLGADFTLISDSSIIGDIPCLDVGYRGGINLQLQVKSASTDLHSGQYGGTVPNAVHELIKIINQLYDTNHRITIPYFYYDVEDIEIDVLVKHKKLKFNQEKFTQLTGVQTILKDKEFDFFSQVGLRPTIQVTGLQSGYVGEGFKNAIPNIATANLNFRLVKNQSTKNVLHSFEQWLKIIVPPYLTHTLVFGDAFEPVKVNVNNPFVKKAERILQALYDKKVHYKYSGGGLPVVSYLHQELGLPCVLVPLANEDCNAHGVNENMDIALIENGLKFSHAFFAEK